MEEQSVIPVLMASGQSLRLTPDAPLCVGDDGLSHPGLLNAGDGAPDEGEVGGRWEGPLVLRAGADARLALVWWWWRLRLPFRII